MKLKIVFSLPIETVQDLYRGKEVRIIETGEGASIEAECSLQEAIALINLDQSACDRFVELRS